MLCIFLSLGLVDGEPDLSGHFRQCRACKTEKAAWGKETLLALQLPYPIVLKFQFYCLDYILIDVLIRIFRAVRSPTLKIVLWKMSLLCWQPLSS